jgi:hypothetical protein
MVLDQAAERTELAGEIFHAASAIHDALGDLREQMERPIAIRGNGNRLSGLAIMRSAKLRRCGLRENTRPAIFAAGVSLVFLQWIC